MRCLFHCRNTTGLGHLMRGHNIARALHKLSPEVEIIFTGNRESVAPAFLEYPYVPYLGTKSVAALHPDVIVLDTLFPNWKIEDNVTVVYVMRQIRQAKLQTFLGDPLAARTDAVLIPHYQEEFSADLPDWFVKKAYWVGPIVREPNQKIQNLLRKKFEIEKTDFILTSNAGGGGKTEESSFFFDIISAVHESLRSVFSNLRHFVVLGPYSHVTVSPQSRMTILPMEPHLNDLFALSNVVIAKGGYNTVHEVLAAKVPAIFIPSSRKYDNQEERVRNMEKKGLCAVFTGSSINDIASQILEIFNRGTKFAEMKSHLEKEPLIIGNRTAAARILGIAKQRMKQSKLNADKVKYS
jgi:predicted glycosyltransferase